MTYALENRDESQRLEKQSQLKNYDLADELRDAYVERNQQVLDAGCGTGLLSRYLIERFGRLQIDACDVSDLRIQQAKELSRGFPTIHYSQFNLCSKFSEPGRYDQIFSRFVFQHLEDPLKCAQSLHHALKDGGKLTIIDADGIIFDLFTEDAFLNDCLKTIKSKFRFNMYMGRAIPNLLKKASFREIQWRLVPMVFQGEELRAECEQNRQRFSFIRPSLASVFKSENLADRFIDAYLREMMKTENVLFYNKFIVTALK